MKKVKLQKYNLKAINDIVIIEEEPLTLQQDDRSGLTKDVISAIKESRLILPDIAQGFADKFPFIGKVIAKGELCKIKQMKVGSRVMFPRLGGMRYEMDGKQYINIKEDDIHAIFES